MRFATLAAVSGWAVACAPPRPSVGDLAFTCVSDAECLDGWSCVEQRCITDEQPALRPELTASPAAGSTGTVVTLSGRVVDSVREVRIGGVAALVLRRFPGSLQVLVAADTPSGDVVGVLSSNENRVAGIFQRVRAPLPFLQAGERLPMPRDVTGRPFVGRTVALDADGTSVLASGFGDTTDIGVAWVFSRSDTSGWEQRGLRLVGQPSAALPRLGAVPGAITLAASGQLAGLSGGGSQTTSGATVVFRFQPDGGWRQEGPPVSGLPGSRKYEGVGVAFNARGDAFVHGVILDGEVPTALLFNRVADGEWAVAPLLRAGAPGMRSLSSSFSLSGNEVMTSAWTNADGVVRGYVWSRRDGGWTDATALTSNDPTGLPIANYSINRNIGALSADGTTAVLLGIRRGADAGVAAAAWVFSKRDGAVWRQEGPRLEMPADFEVLDYAQPLALGSEGDWFMLGGRENRGSRRGVVLAYGRDAGAWAASETRVLLPTEVTSVATSLDGRTVVAGTPSFDGGQGAVWVLAPQR